MNPIVEILLVMYLAISVPIGIPFVVAPLICSLIEHKNIYSYLWSAFKDHQISKLGRIIALTFYTLIFAPMLILSHLILLIIFLGTKATHLYCEIFKEK
jgi:hypothetical protein